MRSLSSRQRRSAIWWGILLCALVLIAAYILFDLLDVDGSQLPGRPVGTTIVAVLQPVHLGRGFQVETLPFGRVEGVSPAGVRLLRAGMSRRLCGGPGNQATPRPARPPRPALPRPARGL